MALATFKDLVIDVGDVQQLGRWWAGVLGLEFTARDGGDATLTGTTPGHTIWVEPVAEPKSVKNRVHLDIYTLALADLQALGATVVEPQREGERWTVMADPEGGEFCAFVRDELPVDRAHGLVVDAVDPDAIAAWWAEVYDADIVDEGYGPSTIRNIPGMPFMTMDFGLVPEPKSVKNRIHWDVYAPDIDALVSRGATVLRRPDQEVSWTVLADPEGNEFCAF